MKMLQQAHISYHDSYETNMHMHRQTAQASSGSREKRHPLKFVLSVKFLTAAESRCQMFRLLGNLNPKLHSSHSHSISLVQSLSVISRVCHWFLLVSSLRCPPMSKASGRRRAADLH